MRKTNFGGIGVEIMMFKTKTEKELDRVDSLMKQIDDQRAVIKKLLDQLAKSANGASLQKLGSSEFGERLAITKGLLAQLPPEVEKLQQLQDECRSAIDAAELAMPDLSMWATEGRHDVPPSRTSFFLADKSIGKAADVALFEPPSPQRAAAVVDPMKTLFDAQLARRFQE